MSTKNYRVKPLVLNEPKSIKNPILSRLLEHSLWRPVTRSRLFFPWLKRLTRDNMLHHENLLRKTGAIKYWNLSLFSFFVISSGRAHLSGRRCEINKIGTKAATMRIANGTTETISRWSIEVGGDLFNVVPAVSGRYLQNMHKLQRQWNCASYFLPRSTGELSCFAKYGGILTISSSSGNALSWRYCQEVTSDLSARGFIPQFTQKKNRIRILH